MKKSHWNKVQRGDLIITKHRKSTRVVKRVSPPTVKGGVADLYVEDDNGDTRWLATGARRDYLEKIIRNGKERFLK